MTNGHSKDEKLALLNESEHKAIYSYAHGQSYNDVARGMGVSQDDAFSFIHSALQKLGLSFGQKQKLREFFPVIRRGKNEFNLALAMNDRGLYENERHAARIMSMGGERGLADETAGRGSVESMLKKLGESESSFREKYDVRKVRAASIATTAPLVESAPQPVVDRPTPPAAPKPTENKKTHPKVKALGKVAPPADEQVFKLLRPLRENERTDLEALAEAGSFDTLPEGAISRDARRKRINRALKDAFNLPSLTSVNVTVLKDALAAAAQKASAKAENLPAPTKPETTKGPDKKPAAVNLSALVRQTLRSLLDGHTPQQIAQQTSCSVGSVNSRIATTFHILGLQQGDVEGLETALANLPPLKDKSATKPRPAVAATAAAEVISVPEIEEDAGDDTPFEETTEALAARALIIQTMAKFHASEVGVQRIVKILANGVKGYDFDVQAVKALSFVSDPDEAEAIIEKAKLAFTPDQLEIIKLQLPLLAKILRPARTAGQTYPSPSR